MNEPFGVPVDSMQRHSPFVIRLDRLVLLLIDPRRIGQSDKVTVLAGGAFQPFF
jgi:hypothetical protein